MSALAQASTTPQAEPGSVLAKALLNAADQIGLKQTELAAVIGLHRTGITRLRKSMMLDPASKTGELALLLIRAVRALYALAGGDPVWMKHFMRSPNQMTRGVPAEQIQTVQGLVQVVQYLDAIRGKL